MVLIFELETESHLSVTAAEAKNGNPYAKQDKITLKRVSE